MGWPWLDVVFWYEVEVEAREQRYETMGAYVALATWAPERLRDRSEASARQADTRTADEIWRDLLDAEAHGWRRN